MLDLKNKNFKKKILKHLGNVSMAIFSISLITFPVSAMDSSETASQVIGFESGQKATKEVFDAALKIAKSKPSMTAATSIVCLACIPVAGAAASPGLCIACGILVAKTFG